MKTPYYPPRFFAIIGFFAAFFAFSVALWGEDEASMRVLLVLFGVVWLIVGLWASQAERLWQNRFTLPIHWASFWISLVCILIGVLAVTAVMLDDGSGLNAPRPVAILAALSFVVAGLVVMATTAFNVRSELLKTVLGVLLVMCMAVVVNWVVFGTGERESSGELTIGFISIDTPVGTERLCFLPGAILLDLIVLSGWWHVGRLILRQWQE